MRCRRLSVSLTVAMCAFFFACVGATRLPIRDRGPAGEQLKKNELDLSFLESPTVRRDDVVARLSRVDPGWHDPQFFWGRWAESKWGYWWVVAGQGGGAVGDAARLWHTRNLLVTFDDNGAMQNKQLIINDRVLWRQLHDAVVRAPLPDPSAPEVVALNGNASMTLTPSGLDIVVKKGRFLIASDKIARFSHAGSYDRRQNAGITCHTLHFSEKTPVGKKVTFCDANAHLFGVFQYLNHTAPKTMQWE